MKNISRSCYNLKWIGDSYVDSGYFKSTNFITHIIYKISEWINKKVIYYDLMIMYDGSKIYSFSLIQLEDTIESFGIWRLLKLFSIHVHMTSSYGNSNFPNRWGCAHQMCIHLENHLILLKPNFTTIKPSFKRHLTFYFSIH